VLLHGLEPSPEISSLESADAVSETGFLIKRLLFFVLQISELSICGTDSLFQSVLILKALRQDSVPALYFVDVNAQPTIPTSWGRQ